MLWGSKGEHASSYGNPETSDEKAFKPDPKRCIGF